MVQRGRRAVYEPAAQAFEKPTPSNETEYHRKVRMFEHCWLIVLRGRMLRRLGPVYRVEIVSHRLLRYASAVFSISSCSPRRSPSSRTAVVYDVVLGLQLGLLAAAAVGVGIARYYVLVTWATVVALWQLPAPRRARGVGAGA